MENKTLRLLMFANDDTYEDLAKYLEIATVTVSNKMNNKTPWTLAETLKIKTRYNLTDDQYFEMFNKEVQVNERY
jgi:plasmid maintenance system antidote protein VapI